MAFLTWVASWFVWAPFLLVYPHYPWWMATPDDVVSPFGQNEATVRKVYAKCGRFWGDFYWLCIRNRLCGLRYARKPAKYKATTDYSQYTWSWAPTWYGEKFVVDGLTLRIARLWRIEVWSGWKVRGVANDPFTLRQPINMEFTPVFSIRSKD